MVVAVRGLEPAKASEINLGFGNETSKLIDSVIIGILKALNDAFTG